MLAAPIPRRPHIDADEVVVTLCQRFEGDIEVRIVNLGDKLVPHRRFDESSHTLSGANRVYRERFQVLVDIPLEKLVDRLGGPDVFALRGWIAIQCHFPIEPFRSVAGLLKRQLSQRTDGVEPFPAGVVDVA